jgi:hypothetical protein
MLDIEAPVTVCGKFFVVLWFWRRGTGCLEPEVLVKINGAVFMED